MTNRANQKGRCAGARWFDVLLSAGLDTASRGEAK